MALPAVTQDLDDVPEDVRDFYREDDGGGFRLDVEGVEFPEDVRGLKNALKSERRIRENAERQLSKYPEDFDPDRYEELVALAEARGQNGNTGRDSEPDPDPEPRNNGEPDSEVVKRVRESLEGRYRKKIEELEQTNKALKAQRERFTIRTDLNSAFDEIGISDPVYRRAAMALMLEREPRAVEDDGNFKAVITDDLGEVKPVEDYVKEWAKTDEAERFLPSSGATGGGSSGSAAGGGRAGVRSKSDFNSRREVLDFIDEKGKDAFLKLPGALPENLRPRGI